MTVPLTLEDASSLDRLTAWKVTVNGVYSPTSAVTVEDGKIVVNTSRGTVLILR